MVKKRRYTGADFSVIGSSSMFTQYYCESADPITRNQLSYISSLIRRNQIPDDIVDAMTHAAGSDKIKGISKQQASRLIDSILICIQSQNQSRTM